MKETISKIKISLKTLIEFAIINKLTLVIILISIVLDQITKYLARTLLEYGKPVNIIGDFLRFTLVFNRGVSFGLFNSDEASIIHTILPFVVVIIIIFLIYVFISISKEIDIKLIPFVKVSFGLIWGGAFGNLIDRILFSYVIDFIDIGIEGVWRFYIFNIADSCITIGTLLIISTMIYSDIVKKRYEDNKDDSK